MLQLAANATWQKPMKGKAKLALQSLRCYSGVFQMVSLTSSQCLSTAAAVRVSPTPASPLESDDILIGCVMASY